MSCVRWRLRERWPVPGATWMSATCIWIASVRPTLDQMRSSLPGRMRMVCPLSSIFTWTSTGPSPTTLPNRSPIIARWVAGCSWTRCPTLKSVSCSGSGCIRRQPFRTCNGCRRAFPPCAILSRMDRRTYRSPTGELAHLEHGRVNGPGGALWWSVSLVRADGSVGPSRGSRPSCGTGRENRRARATVSGCGRCGRRGGRGWGDERAAARPLFVGPVRRWVARG